MRALPSLLLSLGLLVTVGPVAAQDSDDPFSDDDDLFGGGLFTDMTLDMDPEALKAQAEADIKTAKEEITAKAESAFEAWKAGAQAGFDEFRAGLRADYNEGKAALQADFQEQKQEVKASCDTVGLEACKEAYAKLVEETRASLETLKSPIREKLDARKAELKAEAKVEMRKLLTHVRDQVKAKIDEIACHYYDLGVVLDKYACSKASGGEDRLAGERRRQARPGDHGPDPDCVDEGAVMICVGPPECEGRLYETPDCTPPPFCTHLDGMRFECDKKAAAAEMRGHGPGPHDFPCPPPPMPAYDASGRVDYGGEYRGDADVEHGYALEDHQVAPAREPWSDTPPPPPPPPGYGPGPAQDMPPCPGMPGGPYGGSHGDDGGHRAGGEIWLSDLQRRVADYESGIEQLRMDLEFQKQNTQAHLEYQREDQDERRQSFQMDLQYRKQQCEENAHFRYQDMQNWNLPEDEWARQSAQVQVDLDLCLQQIQRDLDRYNREQDVEASREARENGLAQKRWERECNLRVQENLHWGQGILREIKEFRAEFPDLAAEAGLPETLPTLECSFDGAVVAGGGAAHITGDFTVDVTAPDYTPPPEPAHPEPVYPDPADPVDPAGVLPVPVDTTNPVDAEENATADASTDTSADATASTDETEADATAEGSADATASTDETEADASGDASAEADAGSDETEADATAEGESTA